MNDVVVIGGGAAGFFAAIAAAKNKKVILLEKTKVLLSKVRISGGGRCNVTHACFTPEELIKNYPRGGKELLGPFHRFQPKNTIEWFQERGVALKTEEDGRMFPTTDSSETIISCLLNEANNVGVDIRTLQHIEAIHKKDKTFTIEFKSGEKLECERLILATGSSKEGFFWAEQFGHTIVPTVPSLFTFNIPDSPLHDLAGISISPVRLKIEDLQQEGPLLITHWGFSGPAALKLSAWGARLLQEKNYEAILSINWLPEYTENSLLEIKATQGGQSIGQINPSHVAKQLWKALLQRAAVDPQKKLREFGNKQLQQLVAFLQKDCYQIKGKTTYKQEFVTCGGVALNEVNFKTMESKRCRGLYFAGEILDVDAVTGGFNFQNAWTTGWISGHA